MDIEIWIWGNGKEKADTWHNSILHCLWRTRPPCWHSSRRGPEGCCIRWYWCRGQLCVILCYPYGSWTCTKHDEQGIPGGYERILEGMSTMSNTYASRTEKTGFVCGLDALRRGWSKTGVTDLQSGKRECMKVIANILLNSHKTPNPSLVSRLQATLVRDKCNRLQNPSKPPVTKNRTCNTLLEIPFVIQDRRRLCIKSWRRADAVDEGHGEQGSGAYLYKDIAAAFSSFLLAVSSCVREMEESCEV